MYTRCPSCRSEISFNPPENAANYPDGYKFRLRCPSCGATISVKIPRQDADLDAQLIYRQQNPYATSFEPVYNADSYPQQQTAAGRQAQKTASKYKAGRGRSALMMIFSLLFVGLGIFGYLLNSGTVSIPIEIISNIFGSFDGISLWQSICTDFEGTKLLFGLLTPVTAVAALLPLLIFSLSAIHLIVSFSCLIAGKYSRIYNLITSVCIGGFSVYFLFSPLVISEGAIEIGEYFKMLISEMYVMPIIIAGLGALIIIFALGFLLNMKKKQPKQN